MPNGFHNDPSIDQIYYRYTEHGHNRFYTKRHNHGFASVHIEHHGGYAYDPIWNSLDLYPFVQTRRVPPNRAEMDELAGDLVAKLIDLQASNPKSVCGAHTASASACILIYNWCIVLGDYHVYTRANDASFERIVPPIGSRTKEDFLRFIKEKPEHHSMAHDTRVQNSVGLAHHTPGECVYNLDDIDELIASSAPLHRQPMWNEMGQFPLDSVESTGRVVMALRAEAIAHGSDHVVIRWRNNARQDRTLT